tara:strand:+ start:65 stop:646 length:582 start_codon:yes stop_codon:yes gene_type:complete
MEKKEVEITLFGVNHKGDLKRDYPELAAVEEFKDLSPHEVRFCWLVGNRTSPIFGLDRSTRIPQASTIVWGQNAKQSPKQRIRDIATASSESDFPEDILKGIYKMNTYNPGYRLKAKLMAEYIFENLNRLIVVDSATMMAMDTDEKKKYADFVIKVSSELQGMVERLENSYGVKTINRKTKSDILVNINDVMH